MRLRKAARRLRSEQDTVSHFLRTCQGRVNHAYANMDVNPYVWRLCTDAMFRLHLEIDSRVRSALDVR